MRRRLSFIVAVSAIALPLAGTATSLAAGSVSTDTTSAPSTGSTSATTSTSAPPASTSPNTSTSAGTPARSAAPTPLTLRLDAKGQIDRSVLPDADELFTKAELGEIIPGLRATTADSDAIALDIPGESADERSKLYVTMKTVGKKSDVEKAWAAHKTAHETRAARLPGLYTFFGPGKFGVADSFTDGTSTHVLVTSGDAAAEIWFSGVGFATTKASHEASRTNYTTAIVPQLVTLVGTKVAAGAAQHQKPTSGASASAGPSPSSSSSSSAQSATSSSPAS